MLHAEQNFSKSSTPQAIQEGEVARSAVKFHHEREAETDPEHDQKRFSENRTERQMQANK